MDKWNPGNYLKYQNERTQPAIDLLCRVALERPERIIDLGCGPGNSTILLKNRYRESDITGLDYSEEMLDKAKSSYPGIKWEFGKIEDWAPKVKYDLIFSNAAFQWIKDQISVFTSIINRLNKGGIFAVQMPKDDYSPLYKALQIVSKKERWDNTTASCRSIICYYPAEYYYNNLSSISSSLTIWETTYYHIIDGIEGIIRWYETTGMRPFLSKLSSDQEKNDFKNEVLEKISKEYKVSPDGKVIFPFNRIFITLQKN